MIGPWDSRAPAADAEAVGVVGGEAAVSARRRRLAARVCCRISMEAWGRGSGVREEERREEGRGGSGGVGAEGEWRGEGRKGKRGGGTAEGQVEGGAMIQQQGG